MLVRKISSKSRRRRKQTVKLRKRSAGKLAVMTVRVKRSGSAIRATLPVAVSNGSTPTPASLRTAEIPVVKVPKRRRRGSRNDLEVIPVALSRRKSRSSRTHTQHRLARKRKSEMREPRRTGIARLVIGATQVEERIFTTLAQAGVTAVGIFETIARSAFTVPETIWAGSRDGSSDSRLAAARTSGGSSYSGKVPSQLLAA